VGPKSPSEFIVAVADRLPRGRVLDVATGEGRNALFFAARGDRVVGIDRSHEALMAARRAAATCGLRLDLVCADLEEYPLPRACFDVVVNCRYLQRSLVPAMVQTVRPGGVVVFETFLIDQLEFGHPRNPAFLLQHNELLRLFADLRVLYYEEGQFESGGRPAHLARLVAQRGAAAPG
jgi:SAM-dependent methyltransferase